MSTDDPPPWSAPGPPPPWDPPRPPEFPRFTPPPPPPQPPSLVSVEGRVTRLLLRGLLIENEWGNTVRVAIQVRGRQTGLRVGDRVCVYGGMGENDVLLSGWATKIAADGTHAEVPLSQDDLRRRAREAGRPPPWWQFWRRESRDAGTPPGAGGSKEPDGR